MDSSLLNHMVEMTGNRDHEMLDISVISAVQELAAAVQTRILAITSLNGQVMVRSRAVIRCGAAARVEEYPDLATAGKPIEAYPELAACLAQRQSSVMVPVADGYILWLPIWVGDSADTCLQILSAKRFDHASMQIIAGIVSVYRNFLSLLDYSERDSLTGLLNRKTFDDQLAKMLHAGAAGEVPKAPVLVEFDEADDRREIPQLETEKQWLAVVDIDHFKLVNDKFGHLYGDEVLILIANMMQSSFRSYDRVFRFGGEEFVILLRSATLANAQKIVDRFRTNVESHDFPQVGKVTVSIGFVSINAIDAPVVILGRADQALYYAKGHGRNQACHFDDLVNRGLLQVAETNSEADLF